MIASALACIGGVLARATRPCVTCSFQAEDAVLVHLLRQVAPNIPVIFIDTGHHFAETLAYRDMIARDWRLNLQVVGTEAPSIGEWAQSVDSCCARHKVGPLFSALRAHDTWFTGLRREQATTRSALETVATFRLPDGGQVTKVSPLAGWTSRDVEAYALVHAIPLLPLYAEGYTSIGCAPCTRLPSDPGNPRSGRWGGTKVECGIHTEPQVKQ